MTDNNKDEALSTVSNEAGESKARSRIDKSLLVFKCPLCSCDLDGYSRHLTTCPVGAGEIATEPDPYFWSRVERIREFPKGGNVINGEIVQETKRLPIK